MSSTEITVKVGDRIKVRRPRLLEKKATIVTVKSIREDGIIIATGYHRQARGKTWTFHTTIVRPNEVLEIVE